ncbi:MAG: hypothetical protein RBG13Loki_0952 [Promethearchaeota archaeon CR_4]|nr:MAG: hypothetical protein RBG13Loki_0952 [Candidatus Lokiarchaeota archaeon CR_4]
MQSLNFEIELDALRKELDETLYLCGVRKLGKPGRDAKAELFIMKVRILLDKSRLSPVASLSLPKATPSPQAPLVPIAREEGRVSPVASLSPPKATPLKSKGNQISEWVKAHQIGKSYRQIANDPKLNPMHFGFQYIAKKVAEVEVK